MVNDALLGEVAGAFAVTGADTAPWPDPHPDGSPADEEYSRCLDPGRYRIIAARADAWIRVLQDRGLAVAEEAPDGTSVWRDGPQARVARATWLRPLRPGALPLVLDRLPIDDVPEAAVLVGAGEPAIVLTMQPECGCDACDDGSDHYLRELDQAVLDIVEGALVHVSDGTRYVRAHRGGTAALGKFRPGEVDAWLAEARAGRSRRSVVMGSPW